MTRRVITGLDAKGRSTVLVDGPPQAFEGQWGGIVWHTDTAPVDNSRQADCDPVQFGFDLMHTASSLFMMLEFAPGQEPFWHATNTIDYIVVVDGEVVLELETGEVTLKAGDCLVDRGVIHSWRNDTDKPARVACVAIPAAPVGKGATV
ncbi:MAG: cupin domain-containing protein [Novosphingobium sp.]|nr:cupin domain-containing protein [Novosphingobium sp.]